MNLYLRRAIFINILAAFLLNSFGPIPVYAQEFTLPAPGQMVALSPAFSPAVLKGIKLDPRNPFRFHFYVDTGDEYRHLKRSERSQQEELKQESAKLIKYFLASLTVPEKDLWVNLSPYEKDRIVPQEFGQTEMGRDLLSEDYLLKQITASLIYPESQLGKEFWAKVYAQARAQYGTTNIPVNTFNKVWIVPDKAVVYENSGTAFVLENHLKVMLEQDYLSMLKHQGHQNAVNALGSQIVREIVIPALTKEVNEGKNFAPLRQVFYSLILATWYKKKIKDSILNRIYSNRNKIVGVNVSAGDKDAIYQEYLKAFKKGVYNYIKEEPDQITGQNLPRKYFSGGVNAQLIGVNLAMVGPKQVTPKDFAQLNARSLLDIDGDFKPVQVSADKAMNAAHFAYMLNTWIKDFSFKEKNPFGSKDWVFSIRLELAHDMGFYGEGDYSEPVFVIEVPDQYSRTEEFLGLVDCLKAHLQGTVISKGSSKISLDDFLNKVRLKIVGINDKKTNDKVSAARKPARRANAAMTAEEVKMNAKRIFQAAQGEVISGAPANDILSVVAAGRTENILADYGELISNATPEMKSPEKIGLEFSVADASKGNLLLFMDEHEFESLLLHAYKTDPSKLEGFVESLLYLLTIEGKLKKNSAMIVDSLLKNMALPERIGPKSEFIFHNYQTSLRRVLSRLFSNQNVYLESIRRFLKHNTDTVQVDFLGRSNTIFYDESIRTLWISHKNPLEYEFYSRPGNTYYLALLILREFFAAMPDLPQSEFQDFENQDFFVNELGFSPPGSTAEEKAGAIAKVRRSGKDYYSVLEIEPTADADAVKKAYRRLSVRYHPDKNPEDKTAEEKFKEIGEAYEVLSRPDKRAIYDELGLEGLKNQRRQQRREEREGAKEAGDAAMTNQDLYDEMGAFIDQFDARVMKMWNENPNQENKKEPFVGVLKGVSSELDEARERVRIKDSLRDLEAIWQKINLLYQIFNIFFISEDTARESLKGLDQLEKFKEEPFMRALIQMHRVYLNEFNGPKTGIVTDIVELRNIFQEHLVKIAPVLDKLLKEAGSKNSIRSMNPPKIGDFRSYRDDGIIGDFGWAVQLTPKELYAQDEQITGKLLSPRAYLFSMFGRYRLTLSLEGSTPQDMMNGTVNYSVFVEPQDPENMNFVGVNQGRVELKFRFGYLVNSSQLKDRKKHITAYPWLQPFLERKLEGLKGSSFLTLDFAMASPLNSTVRTIINKAPGGIDLNPVQMSLQVKKGDQDFKFDFNGTAMDAAQVTGAIFTIRTITPVTDLPLIMGLKIGTH